MTTRQLQVKHNKRQWISGMFCNLLHRRAPATSSFCLCTCTISIKNHKRWLGEWSECTCLANVKFSISLQSWTGVVKGHIYNEASSFLSRKGSSTLACHHMVAFLQFFFDASFFQSAHASVFHFNSYAFFVFTILIKKMLQCRNFTVF